MKPTEKLSRRLVLATFSCLIALSTTTPPSYAQKNDVSSTLARDVERRFVKLTAVMSRLLEADNSQEIGGRLDLALMRCNDLGIVQKLEEIRRLLKAKAFRDAFEEEKIVERDLQRVYVILQGRDDLDRMKSEREKTEKIEEELERLERLIEEQKKNLDETEDLQKKNEEANENDSQKSDEEKQIEKKKLEKKKDDLARKLQETQRQAESIRRSLDRLTRTGERGQNKLQKSRASLSQASKKMERANQRIRAENVEDSHRDQEEALAGLKRAKKELEEEIKEKKTEEQQMFMEMAIARLHKMLADQQLIRRDTEDLSESIREPAAKDEAEQKGEASVELDIDLEGRSLARRERALKTDAAEMRQLFTEESSSVIAPSILENVESDLQTAAEKLEHLNFAENTRSIQRDVEWSLEELIEALKKEKNSNPSGGGNSDSGGDSGSGGREKSPPLLNPIKELKLLLNMQRRVRRRTERLETGDARAAPGLEPVPDAARKSEIQRLLGTQEKIGTLLDTMTQRYPIDPLVLGLDNEGSTAERDLRTPRGSQWDPDKLLPDPKKWKGKRQRARQAAEDKASDSTEKSEPEEPRADF